MRIDVDSNLLEYASTARQRVILEAWLEHGNCGAAGRALKVSRQAINTTLNRVRKLAARQGYAPEHDYEHGVPDGFVAKGVSTLYDENGEKKLQWVKSSIDRERQVEILREAAEAMAGELAPLPEIAREKGERLSADLMTLYPITDAHLGMLSWAKETGEEWNLDLSEEVVAKAMRYLVRTSPPAKVGVIAEMGDFLHSDSLEAVTPTAGHVLDQDSRFSKVAQTAIRLLRRLIEEALKKHEQVVLIVAEGNHDLVSSVWLRVMFRELYANQRRLKVDDSELPYYTHRHGKVMLGVHHGHLKAIRRPSDLALIFADDPAWGRTRHRYVHTGHLHKRTHDEVRGVEIVGHPTIAARDAYAARHGYRSVRRIVATTYHADHGEVGSTVVSPEMLT